MRITDFILKHYDRRNLFCPSCNAGFEDSGCEIVGIKEVGRDSRLFMEYVCPKCEDRSGFTLNKMDLHQFATAIFEDIFQDQSRQVDEEIEEGLSDRREASRKRPSSNKKAKRRFSSKSKITLEEQASAREMLENSHTWDDWLLQIGASEEEEIPEKPEIEDE